MSVEIPKVAIVFGSVTPPQGDIIDLKVHLGCTKEVSSFSCLLQNWDKKYSPGGTSPISVGMDGHIDIGRGINVPQIITCRVESVKCESTPTENYIRISGRCWGERIFRRVVTKTYENKKGEEIVKDIIDYYVGLSHVRDETELIEDTDTTYTYLEYENTPVFDILKFIASSADKSGVIGFDFRVAPDGKFECFPKNSKTSPVSLSEKIEGSSYRKDIHRVRNKIMIYGLADKSVPADKDAWTESLTPADGSWGPVSGEVSIDASTKIKGSASIKTYAINLYYAASIFTLNAGKEVNANLYPLLNFFIRRESSFNGNVNLILYDAADKSASHFFNVGADEWFPMQFGVGAVNADAWDVEAGFDWTQIKKVRFDCWFTGVGTGNFWIDGLFFGGRRYSAVREDAASQSSYGLRELVEVDEELYSDNECDLRAKSLLDYFKNPVEYLRLRTTVLDYGNNPLLPGDKIHVTLPNENVDADFRIESVEYYVDAKSQTLEITFELGKVPPLLADYIYGLRATTVTVEKLARTKLGKGAIPTAGGGGGGGGFSGGNLIPAADDTYDIGEGTTPKRWRDIYLSGAIKALASGVAVHLLPNVNATYDLGSSTKKWSNIYANGLCSVGWLNVGDFTVITSARVLQNVTAAASIITSGRFPLARLPEGDSGKFLRAYGAGYDPMYALLAVADIPSLPASKITSGQFPLARLPRGTSGYVLEAEGAGYDPMYVNPNGRYTPKSHTHSHGTLTGIGANDHHARDHNHAGETLSPNTVNCNSISIAGSCNRQYTHPSSQQCVYASSVAWENCPRFYCVNYQSGDLVFANKFRITEAENLGLGKGLAFLNSKGKVILFLDEDGNIEISGKLKENVKRGVAA